MLSYRHAYHAGNHADVLKHLVLAHCLEHMNAKDKPYLVADTHAGAGIYALESHSAQRTGEYLSGIGRIWGRKDLPPALAPLIELLHGLNSDGKLRVYPGSPWLARALTRKGDKLRLCELHTTDFALLRREFGDEPKRIQLDNSDGFEMLKAALPPTSRRGVVLIDPSYEIKSDYTKVAVAVKDAIGRFATGTYLVWHPLLPLIEANALPTKLKKLGAKHWLHATLQVRAASTKGHGMHGSGMFVVNPPWKLDAALREALPYLATHLALDEKATWNVESFESSPNDGAPSR